RTRLGPAWRPHIGSGSLPGAQAAQETADRLLPDVLRRHRGLRRVLRDDVRAGFLRRRPRAVRVRRAVRSGEGSDVHPRDDQDHRPAADLERGPRADLLAERRRAAQAGELGTPTAARAETAETPSRPTRRTRRLSSWWPVRRGEDAEPFAATSAIR